MSEKALKGNETTKGLETLLKKLKRGKSYVRPKEPSEKDQKQKNTSKVRRRRTEREFGSCRGGPRAARGESNRGAAGGRERPGKRIRKTQPPEARTKSVGAVAKKGGSGSTLESKKKKKKKTVLGKSGLVPEGRKEGNDRRAGGGRGRLIFCGFLFEKEAIKNRASKKRGGRKDTKSSVV